MTAKIDSTPVSMIMAADLSTKLFRFGKHTSTGINVCTVAGERADGIIGASQKKTPAAGDAFDLYIERIMPVEAGAAYAAGVDLTTDALGRAVTAGAGDVVNAVSIDAATAAGQVHRVRPPYTKPTAGTIADGAVSPATILAGTLVVIPLTISDAATATYDYINAEKLEILDVVVNKSAAGAGNTIQLKNAAGTAISDAIAAAVDKAVTRAGTLDPATKELAAGAGFKITATRAAGSMLSDVTIYAIKRA